MGEALMFRAGSGSGDSGGNYELFTNIFTATTNFQIPYGIKNNEIHVRLFGGGGGGAKFSFTRTGGAGSFDMAAGGAGGYMNNGIVKVTPGESIVVTIGAGGIGAYVGRRSSSGWEGTISDVTANTGGTTSFGSYISAAGGAGGKIANNGNAYGGSGGSGGGAYTYNKSKSSFGGTGYQFGGGGAYGASASYATGGSGGTWGGGGGAYKWIDFGNSNSGCTPGYNTTSNGGRGGLLNNNALNGINTLGNGDIDSNCQGAGIGGGGNGAGGGGYGGNGGKGYGGGGGGYGADGGGGRFVYYDDMFEMNMNSSAMGGGGGGYGRNGFGGEGEAGGGGSYGPGGTSNYSYNCAAADGGGGVGANGTGANGICIIQYYKKV